MQRLGLDYRVFVEPNELPNYPYANVQVLPENGKGLGYSLVQCKQYAKQHGYEAVLKIDDDVRAIGNVENDLPQIFAALSLPRISAICFPYKFEFYSKTPLLFSRLNKRMQTAYFIKTDKWMPHVCASMFEDFFQYIQIINRGEQTLFCSKHAIDCAAVGSNSGGLQLYDRAPMALKTINFFREIDPTLGVLEKPNRRWRYEPKFTDKKYRSIKL